MAWFNKVTAVAGPTPVTIERIHQIFTQHEWNFDADSDDANTITTGFDGRFTIIRIIEDANTLLIAMVGSGAILPSDRFIEALQWANNWNKNTVFGTAHPLVDSDDDLVMRIDISFPIDAGATDKQLERFIELAVSLNLQALESYVEDLAIPSLTDNESA